MTAIADAPDSARTHADASQSETTPVANPHARLLGVRGLLLLGSLTALPPLAIDAYLPAFPSVATDLAAGPAAVQLSLTALLLGLSIGQLVIGPVSDALGRRRPVLIGLGAFVVVSFLCAFAPNIEALLALRFVQGFAGAAAVVIARAVVRDLHGGTEAARMFSSLMLVMGVAPILAPVLGAQLLRYTDWRGIFIALGIAAIVLLIVIARKLPETLPVERRHSGGVGGTFKTFGELIRDRSFAAYALTGSLAFAALFSYVAGSPFVLQEVYGLSAQTFSAVFAVNAGGLIAASQVSRAMVRRTGSKPLLLTGLSIALGGSALLLLTALLDAPLPFVLAALFLVISSVGLVGPNATALALADHGDRAGSASALLGLTQFMLGAASAPLVGLTGAHSALPLGVVMTALSAAALAALSLTRTGRQPVAVD